MFLSETQMKKFLILFSLLSLSLLSLSILLLQPEKVQTITELHIGKTILIQGIPENIVYKNSSISFTINSNKVISYLPLPINSFICIKGKVLSSLILEAQEIYQC